MIFRPTKETAKKVVVFGALALTLTSTMMQPIEAKAASPEIVETQEKDTTQEDKLELQEQAMKITNALTFEDKVYFKDGEIHDALTDESLKTINTFVCNMEINGEKCFPDITPALLEAQQFHESGFIVDATNGSDVTKGSCVGISQSSCKYNIENYNKYCFLIGRQPLELTDSNVEECRQIVRQALMDYPLLSAAIEAEQLQFYYDKCPTKYAEMDGGATKYALSQYRWGLVDYVKEYNGSSSYANSIMEDALVRQEGYDTYQLFENPTNENVETILEYRFGNVAADYYVNQTGYIPNDLHQVMNHYLNENGINSQQDELGNVVYVVDNDEETEMEMV